MAVAVTGMSDAHLSEARPQIERAGPAGAETLRADVRSYADVERAINATVSRFGGLDILINNAGVGRYRERRRHEAGRVVGGDRHEPDRRVQRLPRGDPAHARSAAAGFIINISSLAGKNPFIGGAAYCASKAGLNAFSEALMQEVRYDNIRVSYVMPGSVATGFGGTGAARGADWKARAGGCRGGGARSAAPRSSEPAEGRVELRPSRPRK